uniref:Uncharacterized protein n=1 Tax=Anguilla anguilla TaxID=7936 RepID=A0A0E9UHB5_ANGAN
MFKPHREPRQITGNTLHWFNCHQPFPECSYCLDNMCPFQSEDTEQKTSKNNE